MFQSPILDVGVGLLLVFLIVALICTSVNEYIAQIFSLRAQGLVKAVRDLFQNCGPDPAKAFADKVFGQGLVNAMSPPGKNPSYIPSTIFSMAITDVVGLHDVLQALTGGKSVAELLDEAKQAHSGDIDGKVYDILKPLAVAAGNDMDAFRTNVESWFDSAMQRAGGWYKRRIQVITTIVAFAICLLFNIDTLMIANTLWVNPAARATLQASAGAIGKATPPTNSGGGTTSGNGTGPTGGANSVQTASEALLSTSAVQQAEVQVSGLIGWSTEPKAKQDTKAATDAPAPKDPRGFPEDTAGRFMKLLGILLTVAAANMGAPFWFGILQRVVSIRSSGTSPNDANADQPARIASTVTGQSSSSSGVSGTSQSSSSSGAARGA